MELSVKQALIEKITAVVVRTTSLYSQNLFTKLGFRSISQVKYNNFKNENNEVVFKYMEPHENMDIMILYL